MNLKDTFRAIESVAGSTYGHSDVVLSLRANILSVERNGCAVWSHSMHANLYLDIDLEFLDVLRDYHFKRMAQIVFKDYENYCEKEYLSDPDDEESLARFYQAIEWAKKELGDLLE